MPRPAILTGEFWGDTAPGCEKTTWADVARMAVAITSFAAIVVLGGPSAEQGQPAGQTPSSPAVSQRP